MGITIKSSGFLLFQLQNQNYSKKTSQKAEKWQNVHLVFEIAYI